MMVNISLMRFLALQTDVEQVAKVEVIKESIEKQQKPEEHPAAPAPERGL